MHVRLCLATVWGLLAATSAQAQFHERVHGYFREHVSRPPLMLAPRHEVEPAPVSRSIPSARGGGDGDACDTAATAPDAAIPACTRIIARGPVRNGYGVAVAYGHRGEAYETKGDHARAIKDFSQAILLRPGVADWFVLRAGARVANGDVNGARNDFNQAARLDPGNQEARKGLDAIASRTVVATASGGPGQAAPSVTGTSRAAPSPGAPSAAPSPGGTPPAAPPVVSAVPPSPVASASPAASPASVVALASAASAATAAVASTATASPARSGGRVALVIGNGAYINANVLPNPPNDAHAIAATLRDIGFDVEEGENLGRAAMEDKLHAFLHKAASASIVLLFYAGHGMQVDGKNYLVPVDAKLAEASDLPFETVEIDKLLDSLGEPGHTNIILLDACRDNPLARSFARTLPATRSAAVATGLAPYSAVGTGTLIAYATAPGQTALDGQGKDSPFTASLLHFLPTPGLEIRQMLTRVRAEVASQTGNKQIPWDNSSLMGDVVLVAK